MRRVVVPGVLLAAALAACSGSPLRPEEIRAPALIEIRTALEETVRAAREDPSASWHSGWWGNIGVHLGSADARGLCYEWQGLVYAGVLPTVKRVGWAAHGININQGTSSEHHAVLVFDPARVRRQDILERPEEAGAYVLDAWKRGEPDIYALPVWLDLPLFVRVAPRLENPYPGPSSIKPR